MPTYLFDKIVFNKFGCKVVSLLVALHAWRLVFMRQYGQLTSYMTLGTFAIISLGRVMVNGSSVPSYYFSQWWLNVVCSLRNKLQRNFNQGKRVFIRENTFENFVCKMSTVFFNHELTIRIQWSLRFCVTKYAMNNKFWQWIINSPRHPTL